MENRRTTINLQTIVLFALLTVLLLTGCDSGSQIKQSVSRAVSVNCDAAEILSEYDSHGGFHGDGTSFYALQYSDHTARDEIARSSQWKPLPLTDNLSAAVYGDDSHAPLIIKDNDWNHPLVPPISHGSYCFIDRHSESDDPKSDAALFSRASFNFTLAIYDEDADVLYFSQVDS